jgi:glycerol kinase
MVASELIVRFQANILNVPVVRPKVTETTALAGTYAADLATGYWPNAEPTGCRQDADATLPEEKRDHYCKSWEKAAQRAVRLGGLNQQNEAHRERTP